MDLTFALVALFLLSPITCNLLSPSYFSLSFFPLNSIALTLLKNPIQLSYESSPVFSNFFLWIFLIFSHDQTLVKHVDKTTTKTTGQLQRYLEFQ